MRSINHRWPDISLHFARITVSTGSNGFKRICSSNGSHNVFGAIQVELAVWLKSLKCSISKKLLNFVEFIVKTGSCSDNHLDFNWKSSHYRIAQVCSARLAGANHRKPGRLPALLPNASSLDNFLGERTWLKPCSPMVSLCESFKIGTSNDWNPIRTRIRPHVM